MDSVHAKFMGQSATTTTLIGCPAPTGPASHAGEHHRCYPDSKEPDHAMFSIDNADAAIKTYCLKHQNDKITIDDGVVDQVPNGAGSSTSLILRASLETEPSFTPVPPFQDLNTNPALNPSGDMSTSTKKRGGDRTADYINYSIHSTSDANGSRFTDTNIQALTYSVKITIYDNGKVQIGNHDKAAAGAGNSLSVTGRLNDALVITPESQNDYVQFTIGTESWPSSASGGVPGCRDSNGEEEEEEEGMVVVMKEAEWKGEKQEQRADKDESEEVKANKEFLLLFLRRS
ncbi:MAG: hypothetical protein Q9161_001007 [Pseudevernia consocians]